MYFGNSDITKNNKNRDPTLQAFILVDKHNIFSLCPYVVKNISWSTAEKLVLEVVQCDCIDSGLDFSSKLIFGKQRKNQKHFR